MYCFANSPANLRNGKYKLPTYIDMPCWSLQLLLFPRFDCCEGCVSSRVWRRFRRCFARERVPRLNHFEIKISTVSQGWDYGCNTRHIVPAFSKKKSKRINVEVSARSSEYGLVDSMELQILSVFSLAADPETLVQL